MRAIHGVFRGETCVPPALLTILLETLLTSERTKQQAQDALSVLSTRERQILECLAQGMTRKQIAERFTLSPHTVRTHINHVLTKLGVHTTLSAVSIARKPCSRVIVGPGIAELAPRRRGTVYAG